MKRSEVLVEMQKRAPRVAELGQAVVTAVEATETAPADLGALQAAAAEAVSLADGFRQSVTGARGKDQRCASEFEQGLRKWAMGCMTLAAGLADASANLVTMGKHYYNTGALEMTKAMQKLA